MHDMEMAEYRTIYVLADSINLGDRFTFELFLCCELFPFIIMKLMQHMSNECFNKQ